MTKGFRTATIIVTAVFLSLAGAGWALGQDGKVDDKFLLLMGARNAAKAKQYERSITRYHQLLEKDPGFTEARAELGWVLVQAGRPDQARKQFETVLETHPRHAGALKGLLEVLKKSGQKDDAFKVLTQLVRVLPEDRDLRMQLAVELHNRGRYAEAEKHLNILLQQDTDK
jgi:Flp pilus assembly protein TadD